MIRRRLYKSWQDAPQDDWTRKVTWFVLEVDGSTTHQLRFEEIDSQRGGYDAERTSYTTAGDAERVFKSFRKGLLTVSMIRSAKEHANE